MPRPTEDTYSPRYLARRTRREKIAAPKPALRPVSNASATGIYAGAELLPNPGIPAGRYAAFSLPSRVGKRLYWPGGRVEDLT